MTEIAAKVCMTEIGKNSNDLVRVSECCDQRANRVASFQIGEKFQFVENSGRTACNIDLLDSNIFWAPSLL